MLLLVLCVFEVSVERLEALFPESAIALDPSGGSLHRGGIETAAVHAAVHRAGEQARAFENAEVLGNRRERHREGLREPTNGSLSEREAREDRPPRRVRERREGRIQSLGILNHLVKYYWPGSDYVKGVFAETLPRQPAGSRPRAIDAESLLPSRSNSSAERARHSCASESEQPSVRAEYRSSVKPR